MMKRAPVSAEIAATMEKTHRSSSSTHAIAAHGNSQTTYCKEKTGEQTRTAPRAAADAAPKAAVLRLAVVHQLATSEAARTSPSRIEAHSGTVPTRGAPASRTTGPRPKIHTKLPMKLSTPQPAACRNVRTSKTPAAPANVTHA